MYFNYFNEKWDVCSLELGKVEKPLYLLNPTGENFLIQYFDGEATLSTNKGLVNVFEWLARINLNKEQALRYSTSELVSIGENMLTNTHLVDKNGLKYAYAKSVDFTTGEALGFKKGDSIFMHYGVKVVIDGVLDTIYEHINTGRLMQCPYKKKHNIIIHNKDVSYHQFTSLPFAS